MNGDSNPGCGSFTRRAVLRGVSAVAALPALDAISASAADDKAVAPVALTRYGKVQGRMLGKAIGFLGVPYGGSAAGTARFLPPTKPERWSGIRVCAKAGPRAIQSSPGSIFRNPEIGAYFSGGRADGPTLTDQQDSENCLVLNILSTSLAGKKPVMVYIHGGGFSEGSAALTILSDRFVVEQDVVLVGVNHRLNVFGYLYLGDLDPKYAESGNVGQLDLIAALEWVRDNIANFGGDPANVTIFGESGGGGKVSALLAMPAAKGLFHRAIIQSGSMRKAYTKEAASAAAEKLLSAVGLSRAQVADLTKIPPDRLLAATKSSGPLGFGPVMDGHSLPHQTWDPVAPPEAKGVALIVGNCKDEGTLFTRDESLFALDWNSLKTRISSAGKSPAGALAPASVIAPDQADKIIAAYRKDYPSESPSDIYFRMSSDRGARRNAIAQAEEQLAQNPDHVYMYYFAWNTPAAAGKLRAFHTSDLPLEMRLTCYPESESLSRQLAGAWAAFARDGAPNHPGLPHWEPYSVEKRATMIFDLNHTQLHHDPAGTELKLLRTYPGGFL